MLAIHLGVELGAVDRLTGETDGPEFDLRVLEHRQVIDGEIAQHYETGWIPAQPSPVMNADSEPLCPPDRRDGPGSLVSL